MRAVRAAGYLPVTWTVTCWDWRADATVGSIAAAGLSAGPGDVIGLHDGRRTEPAVDRSRTVAATERIVSGLTERGSSWSPFRTYWLAQRQEHDHRRQRLQR